MDEYRKEKHASSPDVRTSSKPRSPPSRKQVDRRSWKLIADPALGKGQEKLYRFDGILAGNPVPVTTRDPRFRLNRLKLKDEPVDLPVPALRLDEHFVGKLPPKDVTFTGLNDNINETFLSDMCRSFGEIDSLEIFMHPRTGRHLGVARVLYCSVKSARLCVDRLHNTLKMGKMIQAFLDTGGKQRAKIIDDLTNENRVAHQTITQTVENHVEIEVKDTKAPEGKNEERPSRKHNGDIDTSRSQTQLPLHKSSETSSKHHHGHGSSSSHRLSTSTQSLTHAHPELPVPLMPPLSVPPPPIGYPPPIIYPPPSARHHHGPHIESETKEISDCEFVAKVESISPKRDKEDGEIASDDGGGSLSEEEEDEVIEGVSLEQRIAALLTGKDAKTKNKSPVKNNSSPRLSSRVGVSRPISESKPSITRHSSSNMVEDAPLPHPAIEQMMPFPCPPMPPPMIPPPPFALPPGMRPPPSAIFVSKEQHGALFTTTFELLINELRRTLYRDLCRRLLEQCAFRQLDSWWTKNEIRNRTKKVVPTPTEETSASAPFRSTAEQRQSQASSEAPTSAPSTGSVPDLSEKLFRQGGLFGLRDTLPKLPSFRRKDSQPTVVSRSQPTTANTSNPPQGPTQSSRQRKISESSSDKSISDIDSDSGSVKDNHRRRRMPDQSSRRRKAVLSDESDDLSSEKSSSETDFSSSDEAISSAGKASSSESDGDDKSDQKSSMSAKSVKNMDLDSRGSLHDDARLAEHDKSPVSKVPLISPVTSPQKPKARWASLLHEQELQQTAPPLDAVNNTSTSVIDSKPHHPSVGSRAQPEKQSEKSASTKPKGGRPPVSKKKPAPIRGNKSTKSVELASDSSTESDNDQVSSESSADEDGEEHADSEVEWKPKAKKKASSTRPPKTTPARRPPIKAKPSSAKAKEPLQQQQQQEQQHAKTAKLDVVSPHVQRKPVVKRVNTISTSVKEEEMSDAAEKMEADDDSARPMADPRLPEFLVDHCYVPATQLQQALHDKQPQIVSHPTNKPKTNFKPRDRDSEEAIATSFMRDGIDAEDLQYLERSYEELLQNYSQSYYWLNETHWVKHPPTTLLEGPPIVDNESSPRKKRRMATGGAGCARCDLEWRGGRIARPHGPAGTETVEVCEINIKSGAIELVRGSENVTAAPNPQSSNSSSALERLGADIGKSTKAAKAELRDARSHQRRLLACFSSGFDEKRDILGFNLLKYRKKRVRFARSGIHGWGLYALEPIAAEEMVVEYAGELVRKTVGDLREKKYARLGVDGSYMFRVDDDLIVDATMAGNYGRFINHSCAPNCYAKVITVEGQKKIVIYSKREIAVSEEITYDYKFPLEPAASKIFCHCGAATCRTTLN